MIIFCYYFMKKRLPDAMQGMLFIIAKSPSTVMAITARTKFQYIYSGSGRNDLSEGSSGPILMIL